MWQVFGIQSGRLNKAKEKIKRNYLSYAVQKNSKRQDQRKDNLRVQSERGVTYLDGSLI
jgi:hypothetical protein